MQFFPFNREDFKDQSLWTILRDFWNAHDAGIKPFTSLLANGLNMNGNKITKVANGSASDDAAAFGQISGSRILQFNSVSQTTQTTTTSSTFQATSLTLTITPNFTTSRILIMVTGTVGVNGTASDVAVIATVFKKIGAGTDTDLSNGQGFISRDQSSVTLADLNIPACMVFSDPSNTTSQVTYTVKIKNNDNASTVRWNNATGTTILQVYEILA